MLIYCWDYWEKSIQWGWTSSGLFFLEIQCENKNFNMGYGIHFVFQNCILNQKDPNSNLGTLLRNISRTPFSFESDYCHYYTSALQLASIETNHWLSTVHSEPTLSKIYLNGIQCILKVSIFYKYLF